NGGDLLLRKQAGELDVLQGAGGHDGAGNRWSRAGGGHIEDRQNTRTVAGYAVHRNQLTAGRFDQFLRRFVAVGRRVFHNVIESAWRVLSGEAEMHGDCSRDYAVSEMKIPLRAGRNGIALFGKK